MVGDNGILGRTQKASKDSDESYVKEIVNTSYNSVAIEYGISKDTIAVKGVSVQSSIVLEKGETAMLSAQIDPDNATNKSVTWKSNNTGVATVSNSGTVTSVGVGETNITVTTEDGNKTATCKVTVIQAGEITGEVTWSDGVASIKITTQAQGYTLQYQKNSNLDTGWSSVTSGEKIITINNLKHGDTIYARNYNNGTVKNIKSFDIQDLEDPVANINLSSNSTTKGVAVTAEVTQTDSKSGIDISNCKWVLNTTSTEIGTKESSYTNTFVNSTETINLSSSDAGIYYLHVLTVDYAGNSKETISSAITVSNQVPTITASLASKTTNSITVSVTGQDNDGDNLTATLYTKTSSGSYTASGTASIAGGNGTQSITASSLSNYTDYTYYVALTDNTETVQTTAATVKTYCSGTGHTSSYCSGTTTTSSICSTCSGSGQVSSSKKCSSCDGSGIAYQVSCDSCNGRGTWNAGECTSCGGTGKKDGSKCTSCGGRGYWTGTCSYCKGLGYFKQSCSSCGGAGTITNSGSCSNCQGTGSVSKTVTGCSHNYSTSHYYCTTHNYKGSVSAHCTHGRTAQHDD